MPGHTRLARAAYIFARASSRIASISASVREKRRARSGSEATTERTVSPSSKLPSGVTPKRAATIGAASVPTAAASDCGFQT